MNPTIPAQWERLVEQLRLGGRLEQLLPEAMEQASPELFAQLYPRRYENVGGWYSPKLIAAYLVEAANSCALVPEVEDVPVAFRMLAPTMDYMRQRKMPYLFLARDLTEAVKRTDFEGEIDWQQLALPYEHGCFVLPRGALVHPTDGECACIFYGRKKADEPFQLPGHGWYKIGNDAFSLVALCHERGMWYDSNVTAGVRPVIRLRNLFYGHTEPGDTPPGFEGKHPLDADLTMADAPFVEQMGVIVFGALLAMQARPGLLTPEQRIRTVRDKRTGAEREFWSPNIIGKDYQLPQPRPETPGTHASPRAHFRRGFFREQRHGAGLALVKTIWIEPTWVMPEGNDADNK